jgi:hypothetical protein
MGKLENLLSFDDFEKNWNPKPQKTTKHTDVGLDIMNENIYTKMLHPESPDYEQNVQQFIQSVNKAIGENQAKDIVVTGDKITFTIRGRKHRLNKGDGSMTLWKKKATEYRDTTTDSAGRVREEKKKKKIREEVEVTIPVGVNKANVLYNNLKKRAEAAE